MTENKENIEYDEKTGAVRSFFGDDLFETQSVIASKTSNKTMGDKATDFLEMEKGRFNLENIDLVQTDKREGSVTESVTYGQKHKGLPVYGSKLIVGLRKSDQLITSSVNKVDYELPDTLRPEDAQLGMQDAISIVRKKLSEYNFERIETSKPQKFIYRHSSQVEHAPENMPPIREEILNLAKGTDGKAYIVWQVLCDTQLPNGNWEFLVDAEKGEIIEARDCRTYSIKAYVFMPDPITSSGNSSLSSQTYADNPASLNAERREVVINNLNNSSNGQYKLEGIWAECRDIEPPSVSHPVTNTDFKYDVTDRSFLSVMSYYWIDSLIQYLRGFNIPTFNQTVENIKLGLDGQGVNGEDNSHFTTDASRKPYLAFGEGGVPDAADASVIAHEYGHALHWYVGSRQNISGNEEGFGDFLAGVWLDRFNTKQFERESVFPFDNNLTDRYTNERFFTTNRKFSDSNFNSLSIHIKGSVLAATLWEIYLSMGGNSSNSNERESAADSIIHLYMEMLISMPSNASVLQLARGFTNTDKILNGGVNVGHIETAFSNRGLNI